MKSNGSVERFSEDMLRLSKGLRSLISLYNSINSGKLKSISNNYSIIKECMVQLLADLYGGSCAFNESNHMFVIHYSRKLGEINSDRTLMREIEFRDHKQLNLFLTQMKTLVEMIETRKFVHLLLAGTEDYITTDLTTTEEWKEGKSEDNHDSQTEEIFYGPYRGDKRKGISFIDEAVIKTFREGSQSGRIENNKYRAQVSNRRNYHVVAMTDFGNKLLRTISRYDKLKEIYIIPHFQLIYINTFYQLAILVLVHFHLSFDNLERIKKCKFTNCSNLTFEKKKGGLKFCSNLCRKRNHDLALPATKCRNRQNSWIRNYTNDVSGDLHLLNMDHCKDGGCHDYKKKGGECETLQRNNKLMIEKAKNRRVKKKTGKYVF